MTDDIAPGCPLTFAVAIDRAARLWPDAEALVQGPERLTFSMLHDRVSRTAAALGVSGVRRDDHVGICLGNTADWAVLFLALGRIGATVVPVNTRLKSAEIAYTLGQSDVSCLFVADWLLAIDFVAMLREICPAIDTRLPDARLPRLREVVVVGDDVPAGCTPYAAFLARGEHASAADCDDPEEICIIQYTSGTTSFPKGAMLSQRSVLLDAFVVAENIGLRPGDRHLSPRPFFHVAGSVLSVLTTLLSGATLVTMIRYDGPEAARLAAAEACTHISGNDTMMLMLLNDPALPTRKLAMRGGMLACSPSVMERVAEVLGGTQCVTGFGMSELAPNAGVARWDDPFEDRRDGWWRPHRGLSVRIADPATGETVPPGREGEIRVRGWCVMREYYAKPTETAAALGADREMRTGDLGVMRADGKFRFVGRIKDIIRVGGENVAPADIENVLHQHPAVAQAQAVGVPDPRLIEVPAAFVSLREGHVTTPDELIAWCRERMANFKVPRYVKLVDGFEEIGMTASAKVQKNKLAAHARRVFGLDAVVS